MTYSIIQGDAPFTVEGHCTIEPCLRVTVMHLRHNKAATDWWYECERCGKRQHVYAVAERYREMLAHLKAFKETLEVLKAAGVVPLPMELPRLALARLKDDAPMLVQP